MTFQEAFEACENNHWYTYVLVNKQVLGEDTFLTKAYCTTSDGPISGKVDKTKPAYLQMTIYHGGNDFEDIKVPYNIMDPNSEGWEPSVFMGDLSIDQYELDFAAQQAVRSNNTIRESDLLKNNDNVVKLRKLIERTAKEEFKKLRDSLDSETISNYFS